MTTTETPATLSEDDQRLVDLQDRINARGDARAAAQCQAAYGRPENKLTKDQRASLWWARTTARCDLAGALTRLSTLTAQADTCGCATFTAPTQYGGLSLPDLALAHACDLRDTTTARIDHRGRHVVVLDRDRLDEYAALLRAVVVAPDQTATDPHHPTPRRSAP